MIRAIFLMFLFSGLFLAGLFFLECYFRSIVLEQKRFYFLILAFVMFCSLFIVGRWFF